MFSHDPRDPWWQRVLAQMGRRWMVVERVAAVAILLLGATALLSYVAIRALRGPEESAPEQAPAAGPAQPVPEMSPRPQAAESPAGRPLGADRERKIHARLLRSTVLILATLDRGLAVGSGTLIDKRNRLVLTNYHVATRGKSPLVCFPMYRQGELVTDPMAYAARSGALGHPAKLVFPVPSKDLALVQVERLPDDALPLPLADRRPRPGDPVYSVGNPGEGRAFRLWSFTPGTVRQLARKNIRTTVLRGDGLTLEADLVITDSPTQHGDSGGPLVNERGELIAVTQGAFTDTHTGSVFIDVSEVKLALKRYAAEKGVRLDLPAGPAVESSAAHRRAFTQPLVILAIVPPGE
jgi:S1-C subfamily serine protease